MEPEQAATAFVLAEPAERTKQLVHLLREGHVSPDSSRTRVAAHLSLGGSAIDKAMRLLRAWSEEDHGAARLSGTLQALLEVKLSVEGSTTRTELVWTGHKPPGSPLRNTLPVIGEMLDAAQSHVIVMSYSVWLGHASVSVVLDRLVSAMRRGVQVTFVLDRNYNPRGDDPNHNMSQLRKMWPRAVPKPDVYCWSHDSDRIAKLHAKVIVVDRCDLLVTSANLTGHAMSGNLELGTRLIGNPAAQAHDHIVGLISSGVFTREEL